MLVLGNSLNNYFIFSIVDPYPLKGYIKQNISLSFSFYRYCISPIDLINQIMESKINSIGISSIHDLVPIIIKSKKYYNLLRLMKFIKCSSRNDEVKQIIEVNYVLLNKYFPFHSKYIDIGESIIKKYDKYIKIGIHVRLNDRCLHYCNINTKTIKRIGSISKKYCIKKKCINILSSFSKKFSIKFSEQFKNTYSYKSNIEIKHSSLSNITQCDVEKTIVDIYITSKTDIILLNGYSTYSLLILYKGYYKSYRECSFKQYTFWSNGELYDHLIRFRKKYNCKNISYF